MSANDRQVGGDHYAAGKSLQHWDIVEDHQVPYLEGNATKYMSRWHKKNGIQDIEKSLHYLDKIMEGAKARWDRKQRPTRVPIAKVQELGRQQGCSKTTIEAMVLVLTWRTTADLQRAAALMGEELTTLRLQATSLPAGPQGVGMDNPRGFDPAIDVVETGAGFSG